MARLWTEEETRALRGYIDSHLGHCDGLSGSYWDGLSLALEGVRRIGDPILKKHQVSNKIIQFRKRVVSCSHILQYGTDDDKREKLKNGKKRSKSKIGPTEPVSAVDTLLHSSEPVIEQLSMTPSDFQTTPCIEKAPTANSQILVSCEAEHKFERKSDINTPLRSDMVGVSNSCGSSGILHGGCAGLKRNKSDDSCPTSTNSRSKKRRFRRKYAAHERSTRGEPVFKKQGAKTVTHVENDETEQPCRRLGEQMYENTAKVLESPKGPPESDTLSFIDVEAFPWQDRILRAWQSHLTYQDLIHIPQQEPIDHREVLYIMEDISNRVGEASEAMQRMYSSVLDVSRLGPLGTQILAVLTGCKTQSEAADILRIGQSLTPLSTRTNFLRAFIGATLHRWVFEGFQSASSGDYCHDLSRRVFDNFIQRECPNLWASYHNLYHHQFLSTYDEERILSEAKKMSSDIYILLSAAYSTTNDIHGPPPTDRLTFSTAFPIQAQHYQTFKNNMIEAYRLALDLRVCLAKCSDLTYEFHFPKMRDTFDASCMEIKNATGDDGTVSHENLSIAVCLLPSIWSRARGENDYGKPNTLVTKAIVLL